MAGKSLIGALRVTLGLDSAEFTKGVGKARDQMEDAKKDIEEFGNRMTGLGKALTIGITVPLLAAAGAAVKGAQEQAAAVAQVEAAITSMGNAAGRTSKQLSEQADALEMNSLFEGDVILKQVTANLLTFGNVAGEVFDRAQQAAVDMATRLGSEPQAAAIMLGKALNDPIKGVVALQRVGVQLSASQKQQIKDFVASGQAAKAQGVILAELERQFGGAAKAAAETTPWRQAMVQINQTMEQFGAIILPMLPAVSDAVIGVAQALANLSPGMQQVVVIGGALAAAFGPILVAAGGLVLTLGTRLIPALGALQVAFWQTAAVMTSTAAASTALAGALRLLLISSGVGAAVLVLASAFGFLTRKTTDTTAASKALKAELDTAESTLASYDAQLQSAGVSTDGLRQVSVAAKGAVDGLAVTYNRASVEAHRLATASSMATIEILKTQAAAAGASKLRQADYERDLRKQQTARPLFADRVNAGNVVRDFRKEAELKQLIADEKRYQAAADGIQDRVKLAFANGVKLKTPTMSADLKPAALDATAASAGRAGKAIKGIGDAAEAAKKNAEELQNILDELYPEEREAREYREKLARLNQGLKEGAISAERHASALLNLRRNFIGFNDLMKEKVEVEVVGGTKSIEDMNREIIDKSEEALGGVVDRSEEMRRRVAENFQRMVDQSMYELERFANGIKSGNVFDIITGLLGALDSIGAIVTGGKGFNIGPATFGSRPTPGFATGGSMRLGGMAGVDRNLLSLNGVPLARVSAGETMHISPANDRASAGEMTVRVVKGDLFDVIVERKIAGGLSAAAPSFARMGGDNAISRIRTMEQRTLGGR